MNKIRKFDTGATRDADEGKLEYARFFSPAVLRRRAEYMHKHRLQSDGTMRDPDNWKKGISLDVYMDSLMRHVQELWQGHYGLNPANEPEDVLAAIMFNAEGYMFEVMSLRSAAEVRPEK